MTSEPNEIQFDAYNEVLNAFIELRGRGVTVSAQDLDVLKTWAWERLEPEAIIRCIMAIAEDNKENGRPFPSSLKALDRQVRRALRESSEF
ncbi:MAG: hypothetical protein RIR26_318 [Pseudomonadota bacterium]|jgi:hypothetical protein